MVVRISAGGRAMSTVRPQSVLRSCHMDAIPQQRQELFGSGGNK